MADSAFFAPYYSATLVAALAGGSAAGTIAMLLGGAIGYCLFLPPEWTLTPFPSGHWLSLGLYGVSSLVIIWAAETYRSLLCRLREQEDHLRLLNAELNHRIKNTLASIQAIVGQELLGQPDVFEKISARIVALGATHDLLVRSEGRTASIRDILQGEFAPYDLSRICLEGNDIQCPSNLAMLLALMFHELATNAVKYGAFSNSVGRIEISWAASRSAAGHRLDRERCSRIRRDYDSPRLWDQAPEARPEAIPGADGNRVSPYRPPLQDLAPHAGDADCGRCRRPKKSFQFHAMQTLR